MTATIYRHHVIDITPRTYTIDCSKLQGDWTNGRRVNLYKDGKLEYEDFPCDKPETAIAYAEAGYAVEFLDGVQAL